MSARTGAAVVANIGEVVKKVGEMRWEEAA